MSNRDIETRSFELILKDFTCMLNDKTEACFDWYSLSACIKFILLSLRCPSNIQ